MRPENLLLSFDGLHLPPGLHPEAILIFGVHVAVLVPVHLVGQVAITGAASAAGALLHLAPVRAGLMVAAATAARGPTGIATPALRVVVAAARGAQPALAVVTLGQEKLLVDL